MDRVAAALIWLFFLLVFNNALGIAALKFGTLPGRPIYYYAAIAAGLFLLAMPPVRMLRRDWTFFVSLAALVALGAIMYTGDPGPNFGGKVALQEYVPKPIGYVLWPILNFMTAVALYVLARAQRRAILAAVFAALILQVVTMEADMWWPAIFGDPNGRAAGLAMNANAATLMLAMLASLMLPSRSGQPIHPLAIYAVAIAIAACLFAQSKSGIILVLFPALGLIVAKMQGSVVRQPKTIALASIALIVAATFGLSPVLHGTVPFPKPMLNGLEVPESSRYGELIPAKDHFHQETPTDRPLTLQERLEMRGSLDESYKLRLEALRFYLGILKEHPAGMSTGFTNKFMTGPHNEWLKLAVDNGILAALLFFIVLFSASVRAWQTRSPLLISLLLVLWASSAITHTMLVDPIFIPALGLALGFISLNDQAA